MPRIALVIGCLALMSTVAFGEKYPQQPNSRADALRSCNVSSQARWHVGTADDYDRNRYATYSACMFQRGFAD